MSMISEIAEYLAGQGVGTEGTNLFHAYLPDNATLPVVLVRDTQGPTPDPYIPDIRTPTFQIFIRSADYDTGNSKLSTIRGLLQRKLMTTLVDSGILFRKIVANSEGGYLEKNESGQHEFSMNFSAEIVE